MSRCSCGDPYVDDDGLCSDTCRLTFLKTNLLLMIATTPLPPAMGQDLLAMLEHVRGNE